MNGDRLRVAILGAGFIAKIHAERLRQRDDVECVAICKAVPAVAEAMAKQVGLAGVRIFDDFERMLDEIRPDALYVCLPPFAHSGQVELAAERGIHLFLEKPIALTEERGSSMVRAIEKAGVVSQAGFQFRFRRSVERLRELLRSGAAGAPVLFEGRYWCRMSGPPWWTDRSRSGGQVVEQLIHLYDLALHLFGDVDSVVGHVANRLHRDVPGYTIEDVSAGLLRFANGALACITGTNCALEMHSIADFRAVCEQALVDYRSTGQPWVRPDEATIVVHDGSDLRRETFTEDGDAYAAETGDFVRAIRERRPTRAPAAEGLRSLQVVRAVIRSAEQNGVPVTP